MRSSGFTLIELLVVISIIGVLSSVVITSAQAARTKAQYAAAKEELDQIQKDIILAQGASHKTLLQITGSGCSDCNGCRAGGNLQNDPTTDACYVSWQNDITKIQNASDGFVTNLTTLNRDPWGSPFTMDENEGEQPSNPCLHDSLRTVGADGIWGTSDDYVLSIPFEEASCGS